MNKFIKLSLATALVVGVGVTGTAISAPRKATTVPTLQSITKTIAYNTSTGDFSVAPSVLGSGNILGSVTPASGKTLSGSFTCSAGPVCNYTHVLGSAQVKTDSFNYTINYTDANNISQSITGKVVINITLPSASK